MSTIKFNVGFDAKQNSGVTKVDWDTAKLINAHMLISGDSGNGKTHMIRQWIQSILMATDPPPRIHIIDAHGDITVPGASEVLFSAGSPFGFNPLLLDADPHYGGVRKCTSNFINALNRTASRKLGPKQEAVLRSLLFDLFDRAGFSLNDPNTWKVAPPSTSAEGRTYLDTNFSDRAAVKAAGARWDADAKAWWVLNYDGDITRWKAKDFGRANPTLVSLVGHAQQQLRMTFLGTDQRALALLDEVGRKASAVQNKLRPAMRDNGSDYANDKAEEDLQKARSAALVAYEEYLTQIVSGKELEKLFKYESVDVLKSVIGLLENLEACGIFRDALPPFAKIAPVWRYNIKALSEEEQVLFVNFRAQQLFNEARRRGETDRIADILVVDEAKRFVSDEPDHPLTKIGLEARKFGLNLWLASQSPTHIPPDLYASIGTKFILGIDRSFWRQANSRYGISEEALAWISPQKTMLSHMKHKAEASPTWQWVSFANENECVANA